MLPTRSQRNIQGFVCSCPGSSRARQATMSLAPPPTQPSGVVCQTQQLGGVKDWCLSLLEAVDRLLYGVNGEHSLWGYNSIYESRGAVVKFIHCFHLETRFTSTIVVRTVHLKEYACILFLGGFRCRPACTSSKCCPISTRYRKETGCWKARFCSFHGQ